jgi:hypothetical protein
MATGDFSPDQQSLSILRRPGWAARLGFRERAVMRQRKDKNFPPALTQYFDPPEGYLGEFGWLCGYSADALFMEAATERFTMSTRAARAKEGHIALTMMLDPGNPQISLVEVPGLLHSPYIEKASKPFRLLHAKVALLGFRGKHHNDFLVRLVVSTGNWTRDTLESSIDLVWSTAVGSAELEKQPGHLMTQCADIRAAQAFVEYVGSLFDLRLLDSMPGTRTSETSNRRKRLTSWLRKIADRAGDATPHFFHNRSQPLLDQLREKVGDIAGSTTRNRLLVGSGFFEGRSAEEDESAVSLGKIVQTLRSANLVTRGCPVELFANRTTCAGLTGLCERDGWTLREGRWEQAPERTLHAKFIFSGFEQSRSDSCGSAWLYLGSGNLTKPGFTSRASARGGNLEAGVVVNASGLEWKSLPKLLPVSDKAALLTPTDIAASQQEEDRLLSYLAAPVHAFHIEMSHNGCLLVPHPWPLPATVTVLDANDQPCNASDGGYAWEGPIPRLVRVEWREEDELRFASVPTVDEYGRIAGATLPELTLEDAWDELIYFPSAGEDGEDEDGFETHGSAPSTGLPSRESNYAIRRIMTLVEKIASAQCEADESEWPLWCARLEQVLTRTANCESVHACQALGVNVLSPLRERSFRPDFAIGKTSHALCYESALNAVEDAWQMRHLRPLGG